MLLIATSDKGGTGRSVTGCNVVYRRALLGDNVCYVDFDFGSPTAGAVFGISRLARGTTSGHGTHSYLQGHSAVLEECDVWGQSEVESLRFKPPGSGRLVLIPGDVGGGEFASTPEVVERCVALFLRLEEEFEITVIDLSAGRSYAAEIVLQATAARLLSEHPCRWLVFHRWTHQHIVAAAGLVEGAQGLADVAQQQAASGQEAHVREAFMRTVRYVRTAVVEPSSPDIEGLRPSQHAWLQKVNQSLKALATRRRIGEPHVLGTVPLDPVLQWQEQLITDEDVWGRHIANVSTVEAFEVLAKSLDDPHVWGQP